MLPSSWSQSAATTALRKVHSELFRVKLLREIPHWWILVRTAPSIRALRRGARCLRGAPPPPRGRTRRERLRVDGCHRRRVGSAGRGGGASRGAHVPRGPCAEADGRRTGGGSRPPSPCRVCAAPAREAVESGAAQPIRATSVRGTDRTRQCPLCGHGQAGAVWSGDLQGAHRGCVNARFRETAGLTGYDLLGF